MSRRAQLCSILIIGGSFCVAAWGTATAPGAPATNAVGASPANARETALAAVTDRCRLPRTALRLHGDAVAVRPPPQARYEAVDCMLRELAARGFTENMAIGFVGNERWKGSDVPER